MSKGAIVAISKVGERWKAEIYARNADASELVAEVFGCLELVRLVADRSPGILKTGGKESLVDFLRANGFRVSA